MKTVRIGVFETNSSSCHSISIDKNYFDKNTCDIYNYIKDGSLIIELGEFGWGYDESNSSYVKASYILTMCHETNDMTNMSNILDLIGTAVKCYNVGINNEDQCYIDHESVMPLEAFLKDVSGKTLMNKVKNFIFDPGIKIIIDGNG